MAKLDSEHRSLIKQLLVNAKLDYSVDTIIREFSRPRANANLELASLFVKMCRNSPEAEEAYTEVQNNMYDMEPLDALEIFLETYQFRCAFIKSSANNTSFGQDLNGSLSSTNRMEDTPSSITPKHSLSDVKKRLVAAASGGLSKSARSSPFMPISHTVATKPSVSINGSAYPSESDLILQLSSEKSNVSKWGPRQIWQMKRSEFIRFPPASAIALPKCAQEQVMILELISCLMGNDSSYITKSVDPMTNPSHLHSLTFTVSDEINCSLRQMLGQLLPMTSQYAMIDEFIWQHETTEIDQSYVPPVRCSQTHQALAAALREFLDEYMDTMVQLEADAHHLTMFKVQHLLRDTQHSMSALAETVVFIRSNNLNAAQVLSYLTDKITALTGDEIAQQMHIFLAEKAAIPYMDILKVWILKGVIVDPLNEFMLEENYAASITTRECNAQFWSDRYRIRAERLPKFLEAESIMLMRTGKYLNVIRHCGFQVNCHMDGALHYVPNKNHHLVYMKDAYTYASHRLHEMLVKDNDLMGHLKSVKRYLLMHQGDFIMQFMDTIEDELSKSVSKSAPIKVASLLELTLRVSSARDNPYIDELTSHVWNNDLVSNLVEINHDKCVPKIANTYSTDTDLKLYECLSFDYKVEWPVSLVLDTVSLLKYQLIFRMLFYFKYVERQLSRVWIHNKNLTKFEMKMNHEQRALFSLSQRMMHTIQNIEYYIMMEVVEPSWQKFLIDMDAVKNVDDVLFRHREFCNELARECMLHSPALISSMVAICKICIAFSELVLAEDASMLSQKFVKKVVSFSDEFSVHLKDLLGKIVNRPFGSTSDRLLDLVHRLNFNLYFSDKLDARVKERSNIQTN